MYHKDKFNIPGLFRGPIENAFKNSHSYNDKILISTNDPSSSI